MIDRLMRIASRNGLSIDRQTIAFLRVVEGASRRQERLEQQREAIDWVKHNGGGSYTPAAETVAELSNGFKVKKLKTFGDLGYEGHMMNHCLKDDFYSECGACENTGLCYNECDDGRIECPTCDGDCTEPCRSCSDGKVDCPLCYGTNGQECEECDGSGKDNKGDDCSFTYAGTEAGCQEGTISCDNCEDGEVECEDCGGEGRVECPNCEGVGSEYCDYCGGNAVCNECGGTGGESKVANEEFNAEFLRRANGQPYSLRNADDIPVVTWWEEGSDLKSVYGRGDETPKPEYQHLILEYLKKNKFGDQKENKVGVAWAGRQINYRPDDVDNILEGRIEKPKHLYFFHDSYLCRVNGYSPDRQEDRACRDKTNFLTTLTPFRDAEEAWAYYRRMVVDGSRHNATTLHRVDVADINPQHLLYSPERGGYIIKPSKMKEQSPDIFKPVNSELDFSPSSESMDDKIQAPADERVAAWKSVTAASRRQERLQQKQEALDWVRSVGDYTPSAVTVHELPNGYTVKRLQTFGDLGYEGHMMNHCLKDDFLSECEYCANTNECHECSGLGYTRCDACVEGKTPCYTCLRPGESKSEGKLECPDCYGLGYLECPDCYALGWKGCKIPCTDCESNGKIPCTDCEGSGIQDCDECMGAGSWDCGRCEGRGTCQECEDDPPISWLPNERFDISNLNRADGQPYSLRNADDIPVVTWWEEGAAPDERVLAQGYANGCLDNGCQGSDEDCSNTHTLVSVYGRGNTKPKAEYQHMILDYLGHKMKAEEENGGVPLNINNGTIYWGNISSWSFYSHDKIQNILEDKIEKPKHLYFYNQDWMCSHIDDECKQKHPDRFLKTLLPRTAEMAWNDFSVNANRCKEHSAAEECSVHPSKLFRVDVESINPEHLIFSPDSDTFVIKPNKMQENLANFKHIKTQGDFAPSAYQMLRESQEAGQPESDTTESTEADLTKSASWKSVKIMRIASRHGVSLDERTLVEAASRRQERLQQQQEALWWVQDRGGPYQSAAETVHEFPNGFTVKKLKSYGDLGYEGYMMNHCLKDDFSSECDECEGSGECNRCDDGQNECGLCNGNRKTECGDCLGAGTKECTECEGFGFKAEWNPDSKEYEGVDCHACDEGITDCSTCDGDGNFDCPDCDGTGTQNCSDCDGRNTCDNCGGEGGWHQTSNAPIDIDNLVRADGQPYSLRTPDDIPVVTWWEEGDADGCPDNGCDNCGYYHPRTRRPLLESVYGRGNEKPKPEYQHLILDYLKHVKFANSDPSKPSWKEDKVSVAWGRASTIEYSPEHVDNILSGKVEKPNHLYFYHTHYSCANAASAFDPLLVGGGGGEACQNNENFNASLLPRDNDEAWDDFQRFSDRQKEKPSDIIPLYRVDVRDLNPQHLIFSPADDSYIINPTKMKEQSRDIFKPVREKGDFSPSIYRALAPETEEAEVSGDDLREVRTSAWKSVRSN